jgi:hypothetical protein
MSFSLWLTRRASGGGDPSLRLKNGCAQDDTLDKGPRLRRYRCREFVDWSLLLGVRRSISGLTYGFNILYIQFVLKETIWRN